VLRRNPHRQIQILALVPDFNSGTAKFTKPRHLLPQGPDHRADDGDGLDFLESHQRVGHNIRGPAKIALPAEQVTVLRVDLALPHRITIRQIRPMLSWCAKDHFEIVLSLAQEICRDLSGPRDAVRPWASGPTE
jgi:hypothetical protein